MSKILDEKLEKMSKEEQKLWALRHTAEHVLHAAMQNLYPGMKKAMGPATGEGFYFDCDPSTPFDSAQGKSSRLVYKISEDDFPKIEKEMQRLISADLPMIQEHITIEEAKKIFKDNPYKLDWIKQIVEKGEKVSIYKMGDEDLDLCSGPHVKSTGEIKAFKLLSIAGAYWHGDEKNRMLTRIYGTSFPTKEELDKFLWQKEQAKLRDHRKLGKELGLFIIPEEVGPGLLIWTPKGAVIRREIEQFIIEEQTKRGYQHVYSPHIGRKSLWVTSGHWDLYRDKMYNPMKIDKEDYLVKPMNCPMHMMVYKSEPRSYRDLPIRIAENATVYRYEQTGELSGMVRVRYITQDDSHIFCREDQVIDEFVGVIDYIMFLLKTFKISDYYLRLSLRDPKNDILPARGRAGFPFRKTDDVPLPASSPPIERRGIRGLVNKNKYLGDDKIWVEAEEKIEQAVKKTGLTPVKAYGEAAFYGPKVDVMIKDSLGREWQCGTVQVDFMLPERFDLAYVDKGGSTKRPVLLHRAPLGSLERWVGLLIEHYAGAFPTWLAPVQAIIIPISEKHLKYAKQVQTTLLLRSIRVELDTRNETMGTKIREATLQKAPYMLIVGEREEKENKIAVRTREKGDIGQMTTEEFVNKVLVEIKNKV